MNRDETVDLLTVIAAYDNREPAESTVLAWSKAGELGRWTLSEAVDAVHQHFAESTEYLMPAHITERIRLARQDAALRESQMELEVVDPAAADKVATVVAEVAQKLRWDRSDRSERLPLQVRCPHCGARKGSWCLTPTGARLTQTAHHPARVEAAQGAA